MRVNSHRLWLFLLALAAAGAAFLLLLISGWFIAASALAGLAGAAAVFNYVIPAAAIRLLALLRIGSGYGLNYFGHAQLLSHLHTLRQTLFAGVMERARTEPDSRAVEKLDQHVSALANRDLAALLPSLVAYSLLALFGGFVAVMLPAQLPLLLLLVAALVGLMVWHRRRLRARLGEQEATAEAYRAALVEQLRNASVWSLRAGRVGFTAEQQRWQFAFARLRRQGVRVETLLQALALALIVVCLYGLPAQLLGSPMLLLVPLALLAAPDWLGGLLRAQRAAIEAERGDAALRDQPSVVRRLPSMPVGDGPVTRVVLSQFSWQRGDRVGRPISLVLEQGAPVFVEGSSGAGKSSLLMAMAGLIDASGTCHFEPAEGRVHYAEQQPYVLSDTLRNNLCIADPSASDERLQQALAFACLAHLQPALDRWLGDQGRLLSGGERKRLGLARAWLTDAPVWLLDEPFDGVDRQTREQLAQNLNSTAAERVVVVASHCRVPTFECRRFISFDDASCYHISPRSEE